MTFDSSGGKLVGAKKQTFAILKQLMLEAVLN